MWFFLRCVWHESPLRFDRSCKPKLDSLVCSKLHDPARFKVKTHQTVALRAFSAAVFVDSSRDTRDHELWMLEHSLLRSSSLSCSTPRLFIPVKSDFVQSCLDRSAVWTQRRDRSFNTCNLILRLSDLPTYQRAALSVPFNEVCHWRGDDQEGPRWCVKPAGKQSRTLHHEWCVWRGQQ